MGEKKEMKTIKEHKKIPEKVETNQKRFKQCKY